MANMICDLLDYHTTNLYIEPFGGAARVLLNKPRHAIEIYSDSSAGLCSFVNLMSKPETADNLIKKIYETEPTEECFNWALQYRNTVDDSLYSQYHVGLSVYLKELLTTHNVVPSYVEHDEYIRRLKALDPQILNQLLTDEEKSRLTGLYGNFSDVKAILDELAESGLDYSNHDIGREVKTYEGETKSLDMTELLSDIDLAVATYVVHMCSRDSMAKTWSKEKYEKSPERYFKQIDRLYDVADRLNGVYVLGANDAITFLLYGGYLDNPENLLYLDPSYLKADEDDDSLEVGAKKKRKQKNLGGGIYKKSFDYDDHKLLLETIQEAKCKIVISNYDLDLYNEYLQEPRWHKIEFETTTSVGSKKDNKRIECLWYNY